MTELLAETPIHRVPLAPLLTFDRKIAGAHGHRAKVILLGHQP